MLEEKRLRVLISAYACEPGKGSEPGVGWNWAISLIKHCDITVITRSNNRKSIELEKKKLNIGPELSFIYFDLPILAKIKKRIPYGTQFYNLVWEKKVYHYLKKNIDIKSSFDLCHHITFNSYQTNGYLYRFPVPSIRGPVGGCMFANLYAPFLKIGISEFLSESFHALYTFLGKFRNEVRRALKSYSHVVFANEDSANFLKELTRNSSVMLETGIKSIKPKKAEHPVGTSVKLLFVGNLLPIKGILLLLDALTLVKESYSLSIVGEGYLLEKCMQFSNQHNLSANVMFLGKLPYEEVQSIYQSHDVFVFPSLRDTSGNVLIEAMSNELPVIYFDQHGAKEIATEDCGIKIKITDYEKTKLDLAHAIEELIKNKIARKEKGKKALERIEQNFLWEKKSEKMYALYRNSLSENSINT